MMQAELDQMLAEEQKKARKKPKNHFHFEAQRLINSEANQFDLFYEGCIEFWREDGFKAKLPTVSPLDVDILRE